MALNKIFVDGISAALLLFEPRHKKIAREWEEATRAANKELRAQMKPDDRTRGFMYDSDKPRGVIMPVNIEKLLATCERTRSEHDLSRDRIRSCAKAFRANHDLHLMATICADKQGRIKILEGNHRLEFLRQGSEADILINVANNTGVSEEEFTRQIQMIWETCGSKDARISQHDNVVYCNVDFDVSGHYVYCLEQRQKSPYYTLVHQPAG